MTRRPARRRPAGSRVPRTSNTTGLDLAPEKLETLLSVDTDGLREELEQVREHLAKFGDKLPVEIRAQFEALEARLA